MNVSFALNCSERQLNLDAGERRLDLDAGDEGNRRLDLDAGKDDQKINKKKENEG